MEKITWKGLIENSKKRSSGDFFLERVEDRTSKANVGKTSKEPTHDVRAELK